MKLIRKLFFNIWYLRKPPWDTNQTPPELYEFIKTKPAGRALDLGCGTGTNVITLAKNGWQATGVDFIPKAIQIASRKATMEGVRVDFQVGDVSKLGDIQGSFDLILDIGCFHTLDPKAMASYRENIKRLLAPGGSFLIYLFFKSEDSFSKAGVTEANLTPFLDFLELVKRQNGTDPHSRNSAWITYRVLSV